MNNKEIVSSIRRWVREKPYMGAENLRLLTAAANELERLDRFESYLTDLTKAECDKVTLHNHNPDFGGPNSSVSTENSFYPDDAKQFFGDSWVDCLEKAAQSARGTGNE